MRGNGERGEGTPATRTPFASFPPNDFQLIQLLYLLITVISSTKCRQNKNSPEFLCGAARPAREMVPNS